MTYSRATFNRTRENNLLSVSSSVVGYITRESRFMTISFCLCASSFAFHGTKFSRDRNLWFIIFSCDILALILSTFKCRMYIQLVTPVAEFITDRVHVRRLTFQVPFSICLSRVKILFIFLLFCLSRQADEFSKTVVWFIFSSERLSQVASTEHRSAECWIIFEKAIIKKELNSANLISDNIGRKQCVFQ